MIDLIAIKKIELEQFKLIDKAHHKNLSLNKYLKLLVLEILK